MTHEVALIGYAVSWIVYQNFAIIGLLVVIAMLIGRNKP